MAALKGGRYYDVVYDTVSSFEDAMNWVPIATPLVKEGGLYVAINGQHSEWTWALLDVLARPLGLSAQRAGYHHVGEPLAPAQGGDGAARTVVRTGELSGGVPIDSTFVLATNASAWRGGCSRRAAAPSAKSSSSSRIELLARYVSLNGSAHAKREAVLLPAILGLHHPLLRVEDEGLKRSISRAPRHAR